MSSVTGGSCRHDWEILPGTCVLAVNLFEDAECVDIVLSRCEKNSEKCERLKDVVNVGDDRDPDFDVHARVVA